ncbi:biotin-dependent carboxyltransferase family protein [Salegentibacter sp. F188]|uniref:Biotin-dependent carboxyltransferase family protein n=1 Tax=Autumnicola patrickiae TaxID=3075591 RepID=A0ABU3DWT6_9FLAO|nr:biotin-dependent carboxyltransferase family protein [Salegentibacter sp. F188]MDT0688191.1 biotin-dependent carboxyltransferase family protein [Salegentibacter sp. F188]
MSKIDVLQPGLFSTIQDFGRFGFLDFGVPQSGAMDFYAAKMANLILRNKANDAVLEITQMGPKLQFSAPTEIAIAGADLSPKINGNEVENISILKIVDGDVLSFGRRKNGCRAYLAVKHGFESELLMNSRSWYTGLTESYKLEKGMTLSYSSFEKMEPTTYSSVKFHSEYIESNNIEVYPGPEYDQLSKAQKALLLKTDYGIGRTNNRMAIQLDEPLVNDLEPIITGPVLPGTVQLTPSGKLIVLMRDCQTTGGYPRILQLSGDGINGIAQKVAGDKIEFVLKELKNITK